MVKFFTSIIVKVFFWANASSVEKERWKRNLKLWRRRCLEEFCNVLKRRQRTGSHEEESGAMNYKKSANSNSRIGAMDQVGACTKLANNVLRWLMIACLML